MWASLFVMAVAVSLEPVRVGLTVLLLNRPRPVLQLAAFLCGGFLMGVGFGAVVLLVLRSTPWLASESITVPKVQIAIGLLALLASAVLLSGIRLRRKAPAPVAADHPGGVLVERSPTLWEKAAARTRGLAQGGSLWVAGFSGLSIALPSVDYLAALAVIHASGEPAELRLVALVAFNVVAFAMVEIPLLSYLFAPKRTLVWMAGLHAWLRSRSRRDVAAILAAAGVCMIGIGVAGA